MEFVIFNQDMYCEGALHFKAGKKYKIVGEIEGKYAISYGNKNEMECSLFPKNWDGFTIVN